MSGNRNRMASLSGFAVVFACLGPAATGLASVRGWGQPAETSPAQEGAPSVVTLEDLKPAVRAQLVKRAKQFIKTPDGRFWDGFGYFERHRALKANLTKVEFKSRTNTGGWSVEKKTGEMWKIRDSADSRAWGLDLSNPRHVPKREQPPTWRCIDGSPQEFRYIDETDRDPREKENDFHAFVISMSMGNDVYRIKNDRHYEGMVEYVRVTDPKVIEDGYLDGRFLLWRDPDLVVPGLDPEKSTRAGKYRYIDAKSLTVSASELLAAVVEGQAEVLMWKFRKIGDREMWERSVLDLGVPSTTAPAPAESGSPPARAK
jgi:hypothetical protein